MEPNSNPSPVTVLILTTITSFMTAFMGSSLNIALPVIGKEFEASALTLGWLSTVYLLTTAALLIPAGRYSDINGRLKFFKAGIILFSTGSLLSGAAPGTAILLLTRIIQGIGSSFLFSTSTAILVSAYPVNKRGRALGINIAAVYFGLSSGPFIGGFITQYWSWRGIFYLNAAVGILITLTAFRKFRFDWEEKVSERFDYRGSLVYILSILLLMTGLSLLPSPSGAILLISGGVFIVFFYFFELRIPNPVFNVSLFKSNKTFTFSNIAALINYSATFAIGFLLSFFLQIVKGLSPQDAGLILITQPLVQALFSPLMGRLSDKYEPQVVSSTGMAFLTGGLIIFCFLIPSTSIFIILINLSFLGLGFALFSSPNVNAVMSSVEKIYYGVASSTLASMRMIGQMFSMGFVILVFNIFIGNAAITPENQQGFLISMRTAFISFSILSFFGVFASFSRGKIHS